ncbi:MAG: starch-binding protein, partial [Ruminococcus sp.]
QIATSPTTPPTQATQPTENGTVVYFENSNNWNNVNIYYWKSGEEGPNSWPGVSMEKLSDGKWKYTVPTGYDNVIFNGDGQQTADLTLPSTSGMTFSYSSGNWS